MNKLAIILGALLLVVALGAAPIPLNVNLANPSRTVTLYPNLLFAVPLSLLAALLLLYGIVASEENQQMKSREGFPTKRGGTRGA